VDEWLGEECSQRGVRINAGLKALIKIASVTGK
jgi:hypothetical protein